LGKGDNCQSGGTVYASRKGYTLLDRRLYLPDEWFDAAHRERWQRCGIPPDTRFTTKQALALEMLRDLGTAGTLPFCWVTCDEAFGRDGAFLDGGAAPLVLGRSTP
jgi:SRSO17 transposase